MFEVKGSIYSVFQVSLVQEFPPIPTYSEIAQENKMASVDVPKQQEAAVRQGSGETATAPVTKVREDIPSLLACPNSSRLMCNNQAQAKSW